MFELTSYILALLPCSFFLVPSSLFLLPCSFFLVPSSFFLVPSSLFLLPCSFFLVPSSLFLLPCSFFLKGRRPSVKLKILIVLLIEFAGVYQLKIYRISKSLFLNKSAHTKETKFLNPDESFISIL